MDITRDKILQAAAELISLKGYKGATTKDIAVAAGVNEVTLFRHFGTKQALFEAVLDQYSSFPQMLEMIVSQMSGTFRDDLLRFGMLLNMALEERREILPLILCESNQVNELRSVIATIPEQLRQHLAKYLRVRIKNGEIIDRDPELMAQAFIGMFFSYHVSTTLLDSRPAPDVDAQEVVDTFVDVFIRGTKITGGEL